MFTTPVIILPVAQKIRIPKASVLDFMLKNEYNYNCNGRVSPCLPERSYGMTKPVIVKGNSVTGQLIIRHLKKGDSFSMMFEYYEDGKRVQKMEKTGLLVEGNTREAKRILVARVQEFDQQLEQQRKALPGSDMRFSDWHVHGRRGAGTD